VGFPENELLPNADKPDVILFGTSAQLCAAKHVASVVVCWRQSVSDGPAEIAWCWNETGVQCDKQLNEITLFD